MPTTLTIIIAVAGLVSTLCGLVLTFRSIKTTSPIEQLRKRLDEADAKLDNDHRRLKHLEHGEEKREEFERLTLHCLKGILEHQIDGNHTGAMRALTQDIDRYLIER